MAKRLLKTMVLPLTVLAAAVAFIACDGTAPDVKYKVTYSIGADATGTAPTETDKAFGEKFKLKSADGITCEGATFDGWSDGSITYKAGATYTMPAKAVTFTAQWQPNGDGPATFSVTYDLNGGVGETPAVSYKGANEKFNLASDDGFSYEGKEFDGWSDGENKYDAGAEYTMSGKAVVFTAQWKDDGELPDNVIFTAYELDYKGTIFLYDDGTGMLDYYSESDEKNYEVKFTYTQNAAAIAITIGGNTVNGTYDGSVLTVQFTYAGTLFKFGKAQEQPTGKPIVVFDANGGTGSAPVIAEANITYDSNAGKYKFTLPQNTYTAPNGYVFDKWAVNGDNNTYKAGQTYFANAGEKLNIKPVWKEAADDTPTGTEYFGNCHIIDTSPLTPVDVYVKAIMFDVEKGTMYYRIDDSLIYKKSRSVQNQDSDTDKPADYGANAKFYEVIIEGKAVKLLLDVGNKLKLYNTSYVAYDNGEFAVLNLDPDEYTVTFDPNNDEDDAWSVTVSSIGIVQKPQTDPVHPGGKAFRYWKDDATGNEYTFGASPTGNITLVAVYAWKITYSAGEGSGTIAPVFVNMWTQQGVVLPDASDLSNGSKVFDGWWDGTYDEEDPTAKNIYAAGERYVGNGNVNFVAQWKVDNSFVVGFVKAVKYGDRKNVTGNDPDLPAKMEAGTTFAAPANTYTLAGYEFDGWELHEFSADSTLGAKLGDYAVGDIITMPAKPVQLVAKWKQVKTSATVTYKAGAHGTGANVVKNSVNLGQYAVEEYPFTADNYYMFIGWKVEGDNSDSDPLYAGDKHNLTDDTVFVAQYMNAYQGFDNDFTVMIVLYFDTSAGALYIEEDEVMLTVSTSGNNITLTPEDGTACTGTFVNNTLNIELTVVGKTYTFGEPNADTTAYAVTYALGEGATGTVPTETDKVAGTKFNLAAATGLTNGDKVFDGWSDGTNKYAAGAEYTMPNHAVTFTAQWTEQGGGELTFVNVNLADLDGKVFDAGTTILSVTSFGSTTNYTAARLSYDSNFSSYKLVLIADTSKTSGRTYTQDAGDTATSGTEFVWKDGTITFGFVQDGDKYKLVITSIKISNNEKLESPVELTEV